MEYSPRSSRDRIPVGRRQAIRIGEFARRVGVTTDTVRFYEKFGFFSAARSNNGYRRYTEHDLETADLIATGKSIGFSLREIQGFLQEMDTGHLDPVTVRTSLEQRIDLINTRISALERSRELVRAQIERCGGL